MEDVFTDKGFVVDTGYDQRTVFTHDDNVVNVGTLLDELVFLEAHPHEAFLPVNVQLGVVRRHGRYLDFLKRTNLRLPLPALTVLIQQVLIPGNGVIV